MSTPCRCAAVRVRPGPICSARCPILGATLDLLQGFVHPGLHVAWVGMTEVRDVANRFSELLSHRFFVDHEPGVLLVWVDADVLQVAELVRQVEARHPAARFTVQRSGAAVAVRMTARDQELADLESRYVDALSKP